MTVFHHYQWDLNYTNPAVFPNARHDLLCQPGCDILRIDAPVSHLETNRYHRQNLPRSIPFFGADQTMRTGFAPGMALLGEAIVSPGDHGKYFGTGLYTAKECDFAYNHLYGPCGGTRLATGDTRVMLAAHEDSPKAPWHFLDNLYPLSRRYRAGYMMII